MDGSCSAAKLAMSFGGLLVRRKDGSLDVIRYEDKEVEEVLYQFPAGTPEETICSRLQIISDKLRVEADANFVHVTKVPVVKTVVKRKRKIETLADARAAIAAAKAKRKAKRAS